MKKEKDGKVVTDEVNSSQENKELVAPSQDTGLSRRDVLKKAAWVVPVILSTQLSREIFAQPPENRGRPENSRRPLSPVRPSDRRTCTLGNEYNRNSCPNNCDWCDGSWWDLCNPNF